MAATSPLMSGNVRVHVVCDYCPQPDGWRPMISMWHVQDGVYVRGSYQLLPPDDFEAHIRRLREDGQTVPLEYERELQHARDRELADRWGRSPQGARQNSWAKPYAPT